MTDATHSLLLSILSLGVSPAVASGIFVFVKWWQEEKRLKRGELLTREQRVTAELDARQAAMNRHDAEAMAAVREDAERYRTRCREAERERDAAYSSADKAWDIARAWKVRAHRLRHSLDNARTIINVMMHKLSLPPREWPSEVLPPLEDIIADNEAHLMLSTKTSQQAVEGL